jgi:hypothetical protein
MNERTNIVRKDLLNDLQAHQKWIKSKKASYRFPLTLSEDMVGDKFVHLDFTKVNFNGANLSGASFLRCNLTKAHFENCNLSGVRFERCNLTNAFFEEDCLVGGMTTKLSTLTKTNFPGSAQICPEVGSFHAFKKVKDRNDNRFVIELLVSKHSKRLNAYGSRKCRCERAKVLRVLPAKNRLKPVGTNLLSIHTHAFIYKVGEWVEAKLDENRNVECAGGIHFFLTRQEAEEYTI